MENIEFPLSIDMKGPEINKLHKFLLSQNYNLDEREVDQNFYGTSTEAAVMAFQEYFGIDGKGIVDELTANKMNEFLGTINERNIKVKGIIHNRLGQVMSGSIVELYKKELRNEIYLAKNSTDDNGFYEITYLSSDPVNQPLQLFVKVFDQAGQELMKSEIVFNAQEEQWIHVMEAGKTYKGTPEFDELIQKISPFLNGLFIENLTENEQNKDVTYLSRVTKLKPKQIMHLIASNLLARRVEISPPILYAFLRQNLPIGLSKLDKITQDFKHIERVIDSLLDGILSLSMEFQKDTIQQAIEENYISPIFEEQIDDIIEQFKQLHLERVLDKPYLNGKTSIRDLLQLSLSEDLLQKQFIELHLQEKGNINRVFSILKNKNNYPEFSEVLSDLKLTFSISPLTKNHLPVLMHLKDQIKNGQVASLKEFARFDATEWFETLKGLNTEQIKAYPKNMDGNTEDDKIHRYAVILEAQFEKRYPTIAFASRLTKDQNLHKEEVTHFFNNAGNFSLKKMNIDRFVAENGDRLFISNEQKKHVVNEVKKMQRVMRLAPSVPAAIALLKKDLHSSKDIYFMGKDGFVDEFTSGPISKRMAKGIYKNAAKTYATVLHKFTLFNKAFNIGTPQVITSMLLSEDERRALEPFEGLNTLFGSLDYCSCEHCNSVFSPAAYLVDLLRFLEHRKVQDGNTAKDILFQRRNDLGKILLNCENTNIEVPYIDLVCELLENAISPSGIVYQTTGTSEELHAGPENVNVNAYLKLAEASHSFSLPFNLWIEEARLYLSHLGVKRYKLMEVFQDLPQSTIAIEFLKMSHYEGWIVSEIDPYPWNNWGTSESDPVGDLGIVSVFLDKTGLSYLELMDFLQCSFINGYIPISELQINNPCDTNKQTITNLNWHRLDRMNRFIRLWRKTGWTISELDQVIVSPTIGNGFLDADLLEQIKLFKEIQEKLHLSVEQLLSFYNLISIEKKSKNGELEKSLYERLFLNKSITNPTDAAFEVNKVTDTNTVETIFAHKEAILATLMLQEKELELLLSKVPENSKLTLENLSILYRYSLLVKSLNLSVEKFLLLEKLINSLKKPLKPFSNLQDTYDFLLMYEQIQHSNFEIELIDYILNDVSQASSFAISVDIIKQSIEQLRKELEISKKDNYKVIIQTHIQKVFQIEAVQVEYLLNNIHLQTSGNTLIDHFLSDVKFLEKNNRGEYLYEISEINFPYLYDAYILLDKISQVIKKLQITIDELKWLTENAAEFELLEFDKIPIKMGQGSLSLSAWYNLIQLYDFKKAYPERNGLSIFNILDRIQSSTTLSNIRIEIAKLTLWDVEFMEFMEEKLSLAVPKDYSINILQRLDQCFTMMKQIGVHAKTIYDWANEDLSEIQANSIKRAVKAHYQDKEWLVISSKLQDQIRDKKREALVQYLVHSPLVVNGEAQWHNVEGLFEYFLIDVEMSSCQATTRILQAVSTVQLFIQRCLMNLENPQVTINEQDSGWKQWKWMRNYRVWEANRKVFLYPENWIEPQLRDDKSPLFKELENELLQNDLTDENVESAFLNYLEKLNDISRLQVCGLYHQVESSTDILHVVAKTKALPPLYYYRKYITIDGTGTWTSWEKVDVDIQTDHLVPVIYNRKLYLFWLEMAEKPLPNQTVPPAQAATVPPPEPEKYWEIQLGYSYYKNGKWSPKVLGEKKLFFRMFPPNVIQTTLTGPSLLLLKTYISWQNELFLNIFLNHPEAPAHFLQIKFNGNVTDIKIHELMQLNLKGLANGIDSTMGPPYFENIQYPAEQHFEFNYLVHNNDNSNRLYALVRGSMDDGLILNNASKPYSLIIPHQDLQFDSKNPFFYQDNNRVYFIIPKYLWEHHSKYSTWFSEELPSNIDLLGDVWPDRVKYTFYPFSHPLTSLFIRELNRTGIEGIMNRNIQLRPDTYSPYNQFKFIDTYQPTILVAINSDTDEINKDFVDFSHGGAYSIYNWELFFHAPLYIACKLSQDQKFEESMKWFHYIFDPTIVSEEPSPKKYWKTKPFYLTNDEDYRKQQIQELIKLVAEKDVSVMAAINAWRNNPFKPHLIASTRIVAYQKAVVMKYIDNILAWADHLFRRDTFESINEATQLYILAAVILGPKPRQIPGQKRLPKTYNDLQWDVTDILAIENTINPGEIQEVSDDNNLSLPNLETQYFCIPTNDKLLNYWDKVADRLFKIRHCQNIEGITRQLNLFELPIDPGKLVEAVASGMDISEALSEFDNKGPSYRFQVVVQKAVELCTELKNLGSSLLSALEKQDAEAIALIRSSNELKLLEKGKDLKKLQIEESQYALEALIKSKETNEARRDYYQNIVKVSEGEALQKDKLSEALNWQLDAHTANIYASLAHLVPDFSFGIAGFGGTPTISLSYGGSNIGAAIQAAGAGFTLLSENASYGANLAAIESSHERRWEEWKKEELLANKELLQIDKQIEGAKIRKNIAELDLKNHIQQIEQAQAVDEYMRNKYTNQELYDWMVNQISTIYMQNYQLAYDIAKKAENCHRYELGVENSSFIKFGYWDSLKKGLLAGEKLYHDIKRMESAYLDLNKREFELTKPISLAQLDPIALMALKETGECFVNLPETLFDMDYPGHYFRRIKSLSITIPAVVGPNTSISCTVNLQNDSYRKTDIIPDEDKYERNVDQNGNPMVDNRFTDNAGRKFGISQSITTSNAVNDHGMFELNFRDERYLPFEGAGAISGWRLQLNKDFKQFDYHTISDVILHLKYTSKDGGENLKKAAIKNIDQKLNKIALANNKKGLYRLFSAKHEFPNEWYQFLHPPVPNAEQLLRLPLVKERFPLFTKNFDIKITNIQFAAKFSHDDPYIINFSIPPVSNTMTLIKEQNDNVYGNLHHTPEVGLSEATLGDVTVKVKKGDVSDFHSLPKDEIEDIFMILKYELT